MGHQALSLFVTPVLKGAQAEQLHQAVVTPFTHSHLQAHLQLNKYFN